MISDKKLEKKILSDKYNEIIFEKGRRRDVYLVGGYIRDLSRGSHCQDRDYIVFGDVMELAGKVKNLTRGTIVTFKKGETTRIATKNGLIFDFSRPRGTLHEDLFKRDFTINAIAWSPYEGIIDPFQGIDDIQKRCVRVIRENSMIDDPLRMLRAYRFAAELNGVVENGTRKLIKILNNKIKETASERITLELFQLLNLQQSSRYLKMALYDGLLNNIFIISYKQLEQNIKAISLFEKITINKIPNNIKVKLKEIISQNLSHKGLLCMALLMKNILKQGESYYRLKLSNKIVRRLSLIQLCIDEEIVKGKNFDIYRKTKDASIDILLIKNRLDCLDDYKRFLRIWHKGIISSEEVIRNAENLSGKCVGIIINEVKKAEYEGRVRNKYSAVKFIKKLAGNIGDS